MNLILRCVLILFCTAIAGYYVTANAALLRSAGTSKYRVLYDFGEGYQSDGVNPQAPLIDVKGTLYGTTWTGGTSEAQCGGACGTVFSISTTGKERVLHSFTGPPDGDHPASVIDVNGTIYGTTLNGGAYGFGTVFGLMPTGVENVLYSFGKGSDGRSPKGSMIYVNGKLYGTTYSGGSYHRGTMFSVTTTGTEHVLYSFGGSDGAFPYAGLDDVNGTLYGTTYYGGAYNEGTVFSIDLTGKERVLHSFRNAHGSDGYFPMGALVDMNGMLYGTTVNGGSAPYYTGQLCNCGTVFSLNPATGMETVLHNFSGGESPSLPPDGRSPEAGLIAMKGTLYGTTAGVSGTVFSISTTGSGYALVHTFGEVSHDGAWPVTSLLDMNGMLYGTTEIGGAYGGGIVFRLTP